MESIFRMDYHIHINKIILFFFRGLFCSQTFLTKTPTKVCNAQLAHPAVPDAHPSLPPTPMIDCITVPDSQLFFVDSSHDTKKTIKKEG
jgi:hypothetical protein